MRLLIAGGCGFIGSNLGLYLKLKYPNYEVICFDNLKRRGSEINLQRILESGCQFIHGDIRNLEDFESISDINLIIDAAAEPSVVAGIDGGQEQLVNINLMGSINLMNFALKYKAKFLFLSTSRVYPIDPINGLDYQIDTNRFVLNPKDVKGAGKKGINEFFTLEGSRSLYGSSKLSVELLIEEYRNFYKLPAVINRMGVIAGPRQMGKVDQGVSVLWMAAHFWKRQLGYFGYGGEGLQVRDILHIDDLLELLDLQIHSFEKFSRGVFNIGGGLDNSISLKEMTILCEEISGNKILIKKVPEDRVADIRIFITDNTKIEEISQWSPKRNLNTIFSDIFEWIKGNEKQLKNIL